MSTAPNLGKMPTADSIPTDYPTLSGVLQNTALYLLAAIAPQTLNGGGVLLGWEALAEHGAPPRVAVVPSGDSFGASDQNGRNPQPFRMRVMSLEWHVWGVDYDSALRLADQVLDAIDRAATGLWQAISGKWTKGTLVNVYGREYVLTTTIELPIVKTPWVTVSDVVNANTGIMVFPLSESSACTPPP
jgi:hypothetical protein